MALELENLEFKIRTANLGLGALQLRRMSWHLLMTKVSLTLEMDFNPIDGYSNPSHDPHPDRSIIPTERH